jgi:Abortive infection C-terminus
MRLDPNEYDVEPVQQTLRGLTTIIDGIAGVSNGMADRHAARYRPVAHHAYLAVNCSNTLCSFLVESYRRQHG